MNDRFKFKVLLKTSEFTILVKPYYILEDSYFIDINQAETEFENKYPEKCFWDFIDEIEKQDYIQEISSDSDLIITKDFTNLIQCTGLKDKNGTLIYEGDIVEVQYIGSQIPLFKNEYSKEPEKERFEIFCHPEWLKFYAKNDNYRKTCEIHSLDLERIRVNDYNKVYEVIGNIYENKELLECQK